MYNKGDPKAGDAVNNRDTNAREESKKGNNKAGDAFNKGDNKVEDTLNKWDTKAGDVTFPLQKGFNTKNKTARKFYIYHLISLVHWVC